MLSKPSTLAITVLIGVSVLFIGCTRNLNSQPQAKPQGGQDGGGGNVLKSTSENVKTAVNKAFKLALHRDQKTNLFYRFHRESSALKKPARIKNILDRLFAGEKPDHSIQTDSKELPEASKSRARPLYDYLKDSELELRESGACAVADNEHADASVSKFEHGAKICFSIENLRKIAPDILQREILSLLLHEIVHLNGCGEREASDIQKLFSQFLGHQATEYSKVALRTQIKEAIERAEYNIELARELIDRGEWAAQAPIYVTNVVDILTNQVPQFADETDAELRLAPARPELARKFNAQVSELALLLDDAFRPSLQQVMGYETNHNEELRLYTPEQQMDVLRRAETYVTVVKSTLDAFLGEKKPADDGDANESDFMESGNGGAK